ncbi:MAG: AlpA family transcriptional regulator [Deferribacteraceae bacterium]|jgi:prophage regulatory protein|nr:AlpA family transcriptional regulator [Deferribacteraceae bacterium]
MRILKLPEVIAITALSRSSIYAKAKDGTFPMPVKLSERSVGWLEHEIVEWLEKRVSESRR